MSASTLAQLPAARFVPLRERPFLPTTLEEARKRGWDELDVVLITVKSFEERAEAAAGFYRELLEKLGAKTEAVG